MSLSAGLDLGGTKLLAALVDDEGRILARIEKPTDKQAPGAEVKGAIEELAGQASEPIAGIGLAVAGFIEQPSGRIAFAPNLPNVDHDLREKIVSDFDAPVILENDANAATWAESRFGAGKGTRDMIMVTVGTGLGGGIVADGKLYRGSRGFAAEFGHIVGMVGGPPCPCGSAGCFEAIASGKAMERLAREKAARNGASAVLEMAGGDPERITGHMIHDALKQGDSFAQELFDELGHNLALGLAGLAHAFDPEVIVVGGGVAEAGDALLEPARRGLAERFEGKVSPPPIVAATMGNDAGAIGAASLAALAGEASKPEASKPEASKREASKPEASKGKD
ncbi:MAG: ROK family protein [Actinomycetota bacterium]